MAQRRQARTLSVMLAVVLWLCLGLALPIVMSLYTSDIASDAVEAAPGDAFALNNPIKLASSPGIVIERGTVAFVDGNGRALPAPDATGPSASPPSQPSQNLRLYNATIALGPSDASRRPRELAGHGFPTSPYAEALLAGRFETLSLRRTTLVLHGFFEEPETLTDVRADVSVRRRGVVAVKGNALLRGQRITLDTTVNVGQAERKNAGTQRLPISLSLKGEHLDFNLDGRLISSNEEIELHGQGEMSMHSGRGVARWFGSYWPTGAGLRDLSVRGQLRFGKQALAFENAVARMDGNEGTGVLGLRLRQPRPVITATLAYKSFDMRPYLAASASSTSEPFSWTSFAARALTVPLGMHLDADLRISADRVVLGGAEVERAAVTIALKDGRLLADVADLKFNEGTGGGQITADFTGFVPKVTIRGKLDQVELAALSQSFAGVQLAQGRAGVVADLAGSGSTLNEVLRGLSGKVAIRAQTPGRLGLDLRGLASAAAQKDDFSGWGAPQRGTTSFDNLDLRLVLRDGSFLTESAEAKTPDGTLTAIGVVNLPADRIDMRILRAAPATAGTTGTPQNLLELRGHLHAPTVAAPTLP